MRQLKRDLCNKPTLTSNSSKTRERIKSKQIMLGVIPWATTAAPSCKIPPAAENGTVSTVNSFQTLQLAGTSIRQFQRQSRFVVAG